MPSTLKQLIHLLGIWFSLSAYAVTLAQSETRSTTRLAVATSMRDPRLIVNNAELLADAAVIKELKLDKEQEEATRKLLLETHGSPGVFAIRSQKKGEYKSTSEMIELHNIAMAEREAALNEILDPKQRDRLREIAYQKEISIAGLDGAILNGFLGNHIGIEHFEKSSLEIAFAKLKKDYVKAVEMVLKDLEDSISSILTLTDRRNLNDVLGADFPYVEEPKEKLLRQSWNFKRPSPGSLKSCLAQLKNKSVILELGIDEIKAKELQKINDIELLRSAIGQKTFDRLKQLVYRVELKHSGLVEVLTSGYLRDTLNLSQSQLTQIRELDGPAKSALSKIEMVTRELMIQELTPSQRESARKLLGPVFVRQL